MFKQKYLFVIMGVVLLVAGSAMGATSKGNVHPNLKLSITERFRMVSWDNAISLSDSLEKGNSFTRHRTCVMGQWWPLENFELGLKLTNEFRYYFVPEDRDFTFDEVIVDQLYFKWSNTAFVPGTLTLGRQNIILGEGFVMMDGHPLDGSRSIYFNGARYDWKVNSENTVTAFYVYQDDYDELLPVIHDQDKLLIEQPEEAFGVPEEAFGVYYIKENDNVDFQAYVIRKNIKDTDEKPTESEMNTLGTRLKIPFAGRFTFTVEGAYQFGKFGVSIWQVW